MVLAKLLAWVQGPSEEGSQETATGGPGRLEPPAPPPLVHRVLQDPAQGAGAEGTTRTDP